MSNTQIADTLVVADTTVKTHVARILARLDLRDRAQAVVVATNRADPARHRDRRQPVKLRRESIRSR